MQVIDVREQVVTVKVNMTGVESEMWISIVYANCNKIRRRQLWEDLENLAEGDIGKGLWAVMGDFNCILSPEEKKGNLRYNIEKSREFQQCADVTELREISYYGNTYTWWN